MGTVKIVRRAVVCSAFVLWPSLALAQIEAPREAAQIQIGPVSLYPSLQIVDAGRDQNVFNDESSAKEDYTFTAASRALAVVKLGANELLFATGNDYVWFSKYAGERSNNIRYAMRLNLSASRFKPFIGIERQRTRTRPNPEIDTRARRVERSALAGFNFNLADRTTVIASVLIDDSTFDDGEQFRGVDLANALNRSGRSATAGVRYALTPFTSLSILGEYSQDMFPDSHVRDARSYSVVPTLEFSPDATIRGRFGAGVQKFQPLDASLPEHMGPVYEARLNWSMFGRTLFELNGSRDTRYSYQEAEPYYLLTGARLNVIQHLVGPFDLLGAADYQHMLYQWHRGATLDVTAPNRTEVLKVVSGGVAVQMGRGFRFTVSAERTDRRSPQDPRQNFQRNRLISSVTLGS